MACKQCRSKDIFMELNATTDGRPRFRCRSCGDTWTNGLSGGEDAVFCRNRHEKKKSHEPDHVVDKRQQ